ncbi:hypothetical protein J6590_012561 [Homalodisca vitripennis]|nr:hypothetical protein J6590_012561 [Homalodisca vitripennis]
MSILCNGIAGAKVRTKGCYVVPEKKKYSRHKPLCVFVYLYKGKCLYCVMGLQVPRSGPRVAMWFQRRRSAKVRTKGCYVVPEKKKYSRLKPLYVFIEATSEESINLAVKVLEELKAEAFQLAESSIVRKVPVGLEDAPVAFDLLNRLLGQGGANLRHIENQTGATVSLRGQQSGFIKFTNNKESEEPLHIRVEHKKEDIVVEAQRLALNLVQTIKDDFKEFSKYESQKFSYIPTTSTIPAQETSASGFKINKERINVVLSSNATDSHKLSPFVIWKAAKPSIFKNLTMSYLPVYYRAQVCLDGHIFVQREVCD